MKVIGWSVVIVVLALLALKTFFIGYYRIPQNGMYPTLPAGSLMFTIKRPYSDISSVKRGDIVVFVREQNGGRYNSHLARYWPARRQSGNVWRVTDNQWLTLTVSQFSASNLAVYPTRSHSIRPQRSGRPMYR